MGKMYDFTLTVGADDSAVNQVLSLLEKNLIKATKKENVITFVADANNVDKTLKEITELHPTVGASVELVIDQSQINKELDFLNSILNSNIDADQIVKKFKTSFTSGIKGLKLGEILNAEVGSNTRSIKNVQSAVNQLVDRLSKVDISKSMDISEMTAYIKDLETAKLLVSEISKSTKLKNVNTKLLEPLVDSNSLKDAYSKIGDIIYNNQETLLTNLQEKSISLITDVQDRLNNILKNGAGFELVPSAELEKAEKELAEMESILELTDKTAKQLEKDMAATVNKIEEFADKDNQNKVSENQKKLIQLATAYAETGVNLFDESAIDKVPEKLEDIAYAVQEARQNLKGYKFELVSEEDVEEQKARVDRIKSEMVEASKSTKESATKIETEPAVESTTFSKKVTEQAITPASIPVEGVIENPTEFAQNVSKQLTVPAQIEVEGKVSDPEKFKWDVSAHLDNIPVDVTFNEISDDEILEFKKKIEAKLPTLAVDIPISIGDKSNSEKEEKPNVEIGVTPVVDSPEKFAAEVSKQLTESAEILVEGKVNAKKFAKEIQAKIAENPIKVPIELGKVPKDNSLSKLPSKIEVDPKISNPKAFAESVTKQAKVPAEIAVKPDAESLKTYKGIISALAKQAQDASKKASTASSSKSDSKTTTKTATKTISADALNKKITSRKDELEKIKTSLSDINKLTPEIQNRITGLQKSIARVSTAKGLENFDAKLNEVKKDAKALTDEYNIATKNNNSLARSYSSLAKNVRRYASLQSKIYLGGTLTGEEQEELAKLEEEYQQVVTETGIYKAATDASTESIEKATVARQKYLDTFDQSLASNISKQFTAYEESLSKVGTSKKIDVDNLKSLLIEIKEINSTPIDIETEESRGKLRDLATRAEKFLSTLKEAPKEVTVASVKNDISSYLEKNTKLSLKARIELQKYAAELKNGVTADRLKEIIANFQRIQVEEREAGREGRNTFDTISQRLNDMDSKFLAQLLSWQDIIRYIREVASAVVELDTALTEMRKVSDESLSSLQRYQDISFGIADEIGVTGQQLQESTADFMRLGESLEDAAESARVANVLMNVSEFESIDEATDSLIAMAAAYSDLEKMDIVDKLNTIGNNYAISTDGIATALQDSASALVTAYNDIDEAVALITAGNAVTQDPSKVGAGLRTIALRLTGTKEAANALNELGEETDTMITTQSKLRETIMNATKAASANGKGFDILDNNGNYKSTYEIMFGLAELYDEIVKKDKELGTNNLNLLLETIAGKNRSNIAASILQNPDLLKNAFEDSAINSANSALEENEKYLESIQGHIEQFKNAVQELFHYLLETGTINKVIDIATDFVNFLTEIVKTLGSTGSLFATGGLILLLRNAGKIITSFSKKLPEISSALKLLTEGTGSFKTVLKALFPVLSKVASKAISFFVGLPTPIKIAAAALVVAYKVWDKFTITVEEAQEAIDNYESKYSELKNSFESHKKLVDEVADKYVELAAGVDTLTNKNLTLSDDDYQEYLDITKELAEAYPELISRSDTYGGYVLTIGDNYKYAADQLRDYLGEEEKRYYYEKYQDLNDYTEKNKVILDGYKDQVDLAQYDVDLANDKLKAVAKLKELVEEYEGASETINLTKIFDEAGISYTARNAAFQAFQAYGLDDLLKLDANEEWLLDLTDVNEANKEAIEEYFRNIVVEYGGDLTVANQELAQKTDDYNAEWKSFQQNFSDALQFMLSGDSISDETRQLARDYVGLFTSDIVEEYANAVNALDDKGNIDYKKLVNRIASQLESLTPELQEKFSKLFSLEISPEEKVEIYEELQALFDEQGIKIPLDFVIADEKDVTERLRNKISQFVQADPHSSIPAVRDFRQAQIEEAFSSLFNELGIDTVEEYNKILSIIAECEDWEEALQKVRDEFGQINETTDAFSFNSLTDAVSDVNKKLLPQFQKLGTLYDEIFNGDKSFDLSGIGADDLDGIADAFNNLDAALNINPPTEEVEKFLSVIGNADSTEKQVHDAFDGIATAYFNAAVEAGNFSEENAAVLEQMLTEMGIANASEVVDYYEQVAVAKKLAADNGKDLANMTAAEIEQFAQEVGASEETANALYILALKKIFLNENWVNEETSVEQVLALAKAAGIATEAVTKLANVQAQISGIKANIANELKSGNPNTTNISDWEAQLAGLEQSAADYANQIEEDINNVTVDIEFSVPKTSSGGGSSASEAGKEDGEDYVDAFEEALKELEEKRDAGLLTEKEFLAEYKALIEKFFGTGLESPISEEDLQAAQEYADSLDDIYKSYNGINNMDRDFIAWDEDTVKKYSDFVIEQFGSIEEGMKELEGTWSTVMGGVENIDDVKIAFSNLLQTDHGLVPLTSDVLWDYIEDIYKKAIDENGVFDVEKFIQLDKEGSDREIYGQMEHVANMIAAAEGQMLNGIKITADDVIAIGTPGEDLPEELESVFKGFSMHDIHANTLLKNYSDFLGQMEGKTEEFVKHMHDYFERLTTYYESVFSAIGTILSHRISALESAKSAAVASITAEKEAAAEAYQAQIDYIDELIDAKEEEIDLIDDEIDRYQEQIDAIDKQIDAIDKQIDALEEANQKRQQAINLQKAQYELEKAQNQRTKLIYKNGQMVYENDTSAVREAKENLEDAEFEIQKQKLEDLKKPLEEQKELLEDNIELLEKRKDLIQDEIDDLQKRQEAIQKAMEASNKYYDKMIKETEAYWDAMIEKLEKTKSKFEQLLELKELANAYSLVTEFFKDFPFTLEEVINDAPGAFDALLAAWEDVLLNANANTENFAESLNQAKQDMTYAFGEIKTSASDTASSLDPLAEALKPIEDSATDISNTATALGEAADNTAELATSSSTASSNTQSLATNLEEVASRSGDVAANTGDSATNIETIGTKAGEANPKVEQLANANGKLADNAGNVAENVGKAAEAISDEGTNAESAYTSLNNIANLNLATIVTQTKLLAEALSEVATALGLSEDATVSALETTITQLSQMSLGDEQTGIIGSFNALKAAVTGVTDAIGGGSGGDTSGGDGTTDKSQSMSADAEDGGSSGLIQAIADLHEAADTHIGTSSGEEGGEGGTVISDFDALRAAIDLVAETIGIASENGEVSETSLIGVIQALPELTEDPMTTVIGFFTSLQEAIAACSAAVEDLANKIKSLGGAGGGSLLLSLSGGEATGNVHVAEATGNVHAGNAYSSGKLGLKKNETALVGEVGQELVYNPKSGTYRTVGDNGPEITRLQKGDLIFNAEQTKSIIKNGKRDHGRSYADGNAIMPLTSEEMELFKKIGGAVTDIQADVSQMLDPVKAMAQKVTTNNTTNIAPVINITGTSFSVSGVTGEDVTRQISDVFEGMISNAYQRAMKK